VWARDGAPNERSDSMRTWQRGVLFALALCTGAGGAAAQTAVSERDGRAWLGASIRDPGSEGGPVVTAVDDGGPAAAAGLLAGDVVLRIDGELVRDRRGLVERIRDHRPGDRIRLVVRGANGVERAADVELAAERAFDPDRLVERLQGLGGTGGFWSGRPRLGLDVVDMDADLARYFTAPRSDGVLVTRVHDDGPAARAGLRAGDLVLGLDGQPVHGVDGLQTLLAAHADADSVAVEVWRRDTRLVLGVRLAPASWLRRAPRVEPLSSGDFEELRRELRTLRRELDDLRREVDLLRRRR
jgi:S1-C subfamily serine protease